MSENEKMSVSESQIDVTALTDESLEDANGGLRFADAFNGFVGAPCLQADTPDGPAGAPNFFADAPDNSVSKLV